MAEFKKLIFVYNANSDSSNSLADVTRKLFKPDTNNCNLCALTYGLVAEKGKWKKFRKNAGIPMQFLHIDEYEKQFKSKFAVKYSYPVILIQDHYSLDLFLNSEKINAINSLDELISEIEKRLDN